jgi:hypothetical protein
VFGQETHPAHRIWLTRLAAKNARLARRGMDQAKEHFDGRRFPRAVRPQKAKDLALLYLEVEVVDGDQAAVFLTQPFCLYEHRASMSSFFAIEDAELT